MYIAFSLILDIDENIVQVYNNRDVKFFYQNLVNIVLKNGQSIGQLERHYLIFEMAITSPKNCFSFITFSDLHSMIGISEIKLDKISSPI